MTQWQRQTYRQFASASDAFDYCREVREPVKATFIHDGHREYALLFPSGHAKIHERLPVGGNTAADCHS